MVDGVGDSMGYGNIFKFAANIVSLGPARGPGSSDLRIVQSSLALIAGESEGLKALV